jgi:hypothetical protein
LYLNTFDEIICFDEQQNIHIFFSGLAQWPIRSISASCTTTRVDPMARPTSCSPGKPS